MSLLWHPERFLGNSLVLAFGQRHVCAYEHVHVWLRLAHALRNLPMQSLKHWVFCLTLVTNWGRFGGQGKGWEMLAASGTEIKGHPSNPPTHTHTPIYLHAHINSSHSILTFWYRHHLSEEGKAIRHVREPWCCHTTKGERECGKGLVHKALPAPVCRPVSVAYAKLRAPSASPTL